MIVLISPTKTQVASVMSETPSRFNPEITDKMFSKLQSLSAEEIMDKFKVSDSIAKALFQNLQTYNPIWRAIDTYQGIAFKNLDHLSWDFETLKYAQDNLIILSALYGIIKPLDGITLYRLDFKTRLGINLYEKWSDIITNELNLQDKVIINLASDEYSKLVNRANLKTQIIDISFMEKKGSSFKSFATYSKIARGKMAGIVIRNKLDSPEALKKICFDGYSYNPLLSNTHHYVFTR